MAGTQLFNLSAMAGIDPGLYEAADMDGASRLQKIWHITLPGIRPTIIVLLIMSIGGALNVGMERQMLLSNPLVEDHTMVLSWFSYKRRYRKQQLRSWYRNRCIPVCSQRYPAADRQ